MMEAAPYITGEIGEKNEFFRAYKEAFKRLGAEPPRTSVMEDHWGYFVAALEYSRADAAVLVFDNLLRNNELFWGFKPVATQYSRFDMC